MRESGVFTFISCSAIFGSTVGVVFVVVVVGVVVVVVVVVVDVNFQRCMAFTRARMVAALPGLISSLDSASSNSLIVSLYRPAWTASKQA